MTEEELQKMVDRLNEIRRTKNQLRTEERRLEGHIAREMLRRAGVKMEGDA